MEYRGFIITAMARSVRAGGFVGVFVGSRRLPVPVSVQGETLRSFANPAAAELMAIREAWLAIDGLIDGEQ